MQARRGGSTRPATGGEGGALLPRGRLGPLDERVHARKPRDEGAFLATKGVGDHKLRRYGDAFMAAIGGMDPEAAAERVGEA